MYEEKRTLQKEVIGRPNDGVVEVHKLVYGKIVRKDW